MQEYIVRRLLLLIPVLILVSIFVFAAVRLMPGDPVLIMADTPQTAGMDVEELRAELGLDKPIYMQYFHWIGNMLHGDFGTSIWTERPCIEEIGRRLPITLEIAILATLISIIVAIPTGVISAIRQDTMPDYVARIGAIMFFAVPNFWISLMVLTFGALWFGWVPPIGYRPLFEDPWANIQQLLPLALILGLRFTAYIARMVRSTMLEVLHEDYIRTAWAKGLTEKVVVLVHALRNALIPVFTLIGNEFGHLLGGAVIVESIFGVPGFGRLILESIYTRDYSQIQANIIILAVLFVLVNLVTDISYAYADPRIRYK